MPYIGRGIETLSDRVVLDSLTASATASYTLQLNSVNFVPSSASSLTVSLNGVIQKPDSSYTVSGSTLTFSSALTSSDSIDFIIAERDITLQTPSAGSVGTSQLANSAVDLTSKVTGTLPVANGGTGVTTAAALANTGNLVLLNTVTTTDATVSDIDFDSTYITSTYDHYFYIGTVIPVNDNVDFRFRVFTGGTLQSGSSDYGTGSYGDGGTDYNDNTMNMIEITPAIGNDTGEGASVFGYIHNPMTSTQKTRIDFISQRSATSGLHGLRMGGGQVTASEANNGVSFFFNSGNFAAGSKISLYGVKQ